MSNTGEIQCLINTEKIKYKILPWQTVRAESNKCNTNITPLWGTQHLHVDLEHCNIYSLHRVQDSQSLLHWALFSSLPSSTTMDQWQNALSFGVLKGLHGKWFSRSFLFQFAFPSFLWPALPSCGSGGLLITTRELRVPPPMADEGRGVPAEHSLHIFIQPACSRLHDTPVLHTYPALPWGFSCPPPFHLSHNSTHVHYTASGRCVVNCKSLPGTPASCPWWQFMGSPPSVQTVHCKVASLAQECRSSYCVVLWMSLRGSFSCQSLLYAFSIWGKTGFPYPKALSYINVIQVTFCVFHPLCTYGKKTLWRLLLCIYNSSFTYTCTILCVCVYIYISSSFMHIHTWVVCIHT